LQLLLHPSLPALRSLSPRLAGRASLPVLLLALSACDGPENGLDRIEGVAPEHVISQADTVISVESGLIGRASDLAVGPEGRVWIADNMNHHLLILGPEGEVEVVGRAGSGPGEFRSPIALGASGSAIEVYDYGNGRLQRLSPSGDYLRSRPIPQTLLAPGGAGMDGAGRIVGTTRGREGALALIAGPAADDVAARGSARAPWPAELSLPNLRDQALEGEVPAEFRNNIVAMLGPEGRVWLLVQSDATLEHYDTDGTLLWARELATPEADAAFRRFFGGWEGVNDWASVPLVWVARWGALTGGELWLLMDAAGDAGSVILRLDPDTGDALGKLSLEIEGRLDRFAADSEGGLLYASQPEEAHLLRLSLP
jgi:hypothetical protein